MRKSCEKLQVTVNGVIKEGYPTILALVTEDGACDHGISSSAINGSCKNEKSCEEESAH